MPDTSTSIRRHKQILLALVQIFGFCFWLKCATPQKTAKTEIIGFCIVFLWVVLERGDAVVI